MSSRIRAADVAKRLAQSERKIQGMAAQGLIPSATKIGAIWTFDGEADDNWVRKLEGNACRKISTKGVTSGMPASPSLAVFDESAYEQAIFGKLKRGSNPSKPAQTTHNSASKKPAHGRKRSQGMAKAS